MPFTVAIIGRPNVGKSTLFNRLVGRRLALVDDKPGVTRDRREGEGRLGDITFTVIDTAGLEQSAPESLSGRMRAQTEAAIEQADAVFFMIDARSGPVPADHAFADVARKSGKPVPERGRESRGERGEGRPGRGEGRGRDQGSVIAERPADVRGKRPSKPRDDRSTPNLSERPSRKPAAQPTKRRPQPAGEGQRPGFRRGRRSPSLFSASLRSCSPSSSAGSPGGASAAPRSTPAEPCARSMPSMAARATKSQ